MAVNCILITGKKIIVRKLWKKEEKEAVYRSFTKEIMSRKVPGKRECEKALQENPCLAGRSWQNIKFCVKNIIDSINK